MNRETCFMAHTDGLLASLPHFPFIGCNGLLTDLPNVRLGLRHRFVVETLDGRDKVVDVKHRVIEAFAAIYNCLIEAIQASTDQAQEDAYEEPLHGPRHQPK